MTDAFQHSTRDEIAGQQLLSAVRGGTRKVMVAQLFSQVVSLVTLAILYRWVRPGEFGLLSMAIPLVMLPRMCSSLGLSIATVQQETLSDSQCSSLFAMNVTLGLLAALVTVLLGHVFAPIYEAPDLVALCRWLAGTTVLASLGMVHQSLLERQMKLGRLVAARLTGQSLGSLAALVAVMVSPEWGVWILVLQQYVEWAVINLAVWALEPWKPGWPRWQTPIRRLLNFGGLYSAASLLFYLGQAVDKMLLAWLIGSTERGKSGLGIYTQSFQLVMKPVQLITMPVTNVMLPALSRAQSDPAAYQLIALHFYRMVAITLLPAGAGLVVVGRDLMWVMAPNWTEAGWMVTALAPAIMAQGFVNITGSVLAAAGKTKWLFVNALVLGLLLLLGYGGGYWIGEHMDGVEHAPRGSLLGVSVAYSLVMLLVLVPYVAHAFRLVGIQLRAFVAVTWRPAWAALAMATLTGLLACVLPPSWPPWSRLTVLVGTGVLAFVLFARQDVRWLLGQLMGSSPGER